MERLVKASELSAIIGLSVAYIYDLAARNKLPHYRAGRSVRFDVAEVPAAMRSG